MEKLIEASQITEASKVAETLGVAQVAARITVEAAKEPAVIVGAVVERLLGEIFESEEAAQILYVL